MHKGTKNPAPVDKPTEEEIKAHKEIWTILRPVVQRALELKSVSGDVFQKAYNAIYEKRAFFQPGRYKCGGLLMRDSLEEVLKQFLNVLSEQQSKLSSQALVEHFGRSWKNWTSSCVLIRGLFMYVENVVPDFRVRLIMHTMWKKQLFSAECKGSIVGVACDIIDESRNGGAVSLDLVRSLVNSLRIMDETEAEYLTMLQPKNFVGRRQKQTPSDGLLPQLAEEVLRRTKLFYNKQGSHLESMSPGDAIKFVNDSCDKERTLFNGYLAEVKVKNVDPTLNECLITNHLKFFLQGFQSIVVAGNIELGKAIFAIFKRVSKLKELAAHYAVTVKKHVEDAFEKNLEAASKDCRKYIEVASAEFKQFRDFGKACFADNVDFSDALTESMIASMNDNAVVRKNIPSTGNIEISKNMFAARVFSQYIHLMMAKTSVGSKERMSDEAEATFIDLYKFLKNKKDFLEQYKNMLARRLLRHESIGIDIESDFLAELTKVKGEDILSQSRNMINDVLKVGDQAKAFEDFVKDRGVGKCPVEPLLCSSSWPIKLTNQAIQLPENMDVFVKLFTEFFNRTSNRDGKKTVTLLHQYGRGDLIFNAAGNRNELTGTEIHLIILPMIKSTGTVSFKQIMDATKLSLEDIRSQLAFLITNSFILVKNDEGLPKVDRKDRSTWVEGTLMRANAKFAHPKGVKKFTIAVRKDERSSEAAAVTKEDLKAAFEDYKMCSEANIVRIMKTRKDFSVNELFSATMKAVSRWFYMDKKIFNAALTELIDQEIIKRDEDGKKVQYIA